MSGLYKSLIITAALLALVPSSAFSIHDTKIYGFTKHYSDSIFKITDDRHFAVELMLLPAGLSVGKNRINLILHDREDKDVAGADVVVAPTMTMHGHGVDTVAKVKEVGGGLYEASDIDIIMSGHWELKIDIRKGDTQDTVTIPLPDIKAPAADMEPGVGGPDTMGSVKGEGMDMSGMSKDVNSSSDSMTVMSRDGAFSVSYKPVEGAITLNQIHEWEITLKDMAGQPVSGAAITVEGGMPAHGHGLPTTPRVTDETSPGVYLLEGIKFSMPGKWVVILNIRTSEKSDVAVFHVGL